MISISQIVYDLCYTPLDRILSQLSENELLSVANMRNEY